MLVKGAQIRRISQIFWLFWKI